MTTRMQIVEEVRSYIGTPFHHQAAAPQVGMDCIGVLRCVGKKFELPGSVELETSPHLLSYGRDPNPALLMECEKFLVKITWPEVTLADVFLMKTLYSRGQPKHFAIVSRLQPMYIIHAWAPGVERVIENRLDEKWRARVLACYRFRGVE